MTLFLWTFIFVVGIGVLIKASQFFTDSSEKIAKSLGISQFLTGVVLLAAATSLPELTTGIFATLKGYSSVVAANAVGSNIANILLILGVAAFMGRSIHFSKEGALNQMPLLLLTTFLLIVTIYDGSVVWLEGLLLLAAYLVYTASNYAVYKKGLLEEIKEEMKRTPLSGRDVLIFLGSLALVLVSAHFIIEAVIHVSEALNVLPSLLGGTAVALGTSLPELSTTLSAVKKKNFNLAIGNIVGSNILNASLVVAVPTFLGPLNVTNEVLSVALPFLLLATLLFTFFALERRMTLYSGVLMSMLYLVFIIQFINPSL